MYLFKWDWDTPNLYQYENSMNATLRNLCLPTPDITTICPTKNRIPNHLPLYSRTCILLLLLRTCPTSIVLMLTQHWSTPMLFNWGSHSSNCYNVYTAQCIPSNHHPWQPCHSTCNLKNTPKNWPGTNRFNLGWLEGHVRVAAAEWPREACFATSRCSNTALLNRQLTNFERNNPWRACTPVGVTSLEFTWILQWWILAWSPNSHDGLQNWFAVKKIGRVDSSLTLMSKDLLPKKTMPFAKCHYSNTTSCKIPPPQFLCTPFNVRPQSQPLKRKASPPAAHALALPPQADRTF